MILEGREWLKDIGRWGSIKSIGGKDVNLNRVWNEGNDENILEGREWLKDIGRCGVILIQLKPGEGLNHEQSECK